MGPIDLTPALQCCQFQAIDGGRTRDSTSRSQLPARRTFRVGVEIRLADAEADLGHKVEQAVISVPAYFSDAQRQATRTAGELAGIRVERLINEPTAAALAYGLQEKPDQSRFLVLDLGGGTFDVSILEMFDGVIEVHASAGDNYLGGEDFLNVLATACGEDLGFETASLDPGQRGQLLRQLEQLKRQLSQNVPATLRMTLGDREIEWGMEPERFEKLCEPLIQRMRMPLERAMRDATLQPSELSEIVLVGGASRMPLVARLISRMFGRLPLRHVNPDEVIALGACVAAGLKERNHHLEEVVLTDVCPYTLGTEVGRKDESGRIMDGFFAPIIHRNCVVPVSHEKPFFPLQERQKRLVLRVFQGESPLVKNNVLLGELNIELDPRRSIDENAMNLRFTYDVNGILQVEATMIRTGEHYELILEQNPGLLTPQEIRQRLAALAEIKIHPRDKQENIALIAQAERLYEEHLHAREQLQQWIAQFMSILETQDEQVIRKHRVELDKALRALDGNA